MIPREIAGPQERFEHSGAQSLRDVRPLTTRLSETLMSEFSGLVLAVAAGVMVIEPASVDLIVPASLCYAALVLTRRVKLPMRLPQSARTRDWNYPDPGRHRRPRMAAGTIYLGRDLSGSELWISSDDARQHATIPGTTGAGKTTAILSFLANALTHASGFVLVDGKADSKLFKEVLALARRFGREDDVLHLNFLVANGAKESNTFNPFAVGNADAIREMVVSQLGEPGANDSNGVFRSRAVALMGAIVPVLVWIRDKKGISIDIERIRDALELRVIWKLAVKKQFEVRDRRTGRVDDISIDGIEEDIIYPLRAYLGEIPGYDTTLDYNRQKSDEPSKQHGFARFYFTATFTQLGVSLGHIFKVEQGDIDMRDVVLNRRILVVSLPALENSSDTLAGLGKIVVASLRGMMAQMLNTPAEKLTSAAPFQIVLDELAYYATGDLDRMLAQGRSLNIMVWLAFQEVSGIIARIGEKTQTLLGNANLTIAMRQQDAKRTREWIQETAGQTSVAQATGYEGSDLGEYHDTRDVAVRQVARVDWIDLQRLIEGETIILFGGRRIYARLFHAKIESSGPARLNRPLALAPPDIRKCEAESARIREIVRALKKGMGEAGKEPAPPALQAMIDGFVAAGARKADARACVAAAIQAAGEVAWVGSGAPPWIAEGPQASLVVTPFTRMLESAVGQGVLPVADGRPVQSRARASQERAPETDAALLATIVRIEEAAGVPPEKARALAEAFLAQVERALERAPEAPGMRGEEMREAAEALTDLIAASKEEPEVRPVAAERVNSGPKP
jgi:intracellular multiplication protein IcmO